MVNDKHGYSPLWFLNRYKTSQRPRLCRRCGQNAYYYHDDWDWLCAAHLLDLVNIGENAFSWQDYPEVWARTERLLQRKPLRSSGVSVVESTKNVTEEWKLDGIND
jgi:hypothetical protein